MHVLVRDGLVDLDYVSRHAVGYDALAERVQEYAPERVAATVGLPADEIERFAREYATTQPSLLRPLIGLEHHRNGAMQFRALACLAVLSGSFKHRGGGLARSTHALHFATLAMDRVLMPEVYKPGARVLNMRDIGRDLCSRELGRRSARSSSTAPTRWCRCRIRRRIREGLLREDLFTVVHDLFVTETARYADYVLPATSQIEHLDLAPAWGHLYLALNRPAIAPRGESVSNTELFRRLARRSAAPNRGSSRATSRCCATRSRAGIRGSTASPTSGCGTRASCGSIGPRTGGRSPTAASRRRSGKAELYSETLREAGHDALPWAGDIPTGRGLQLITGKTLHFLNSGYNHMDRHRRRTGELFIELHADDARERGVATGDLVRVWNDRGEVQRRVPRFRSRAPLCRLDAVRRLHRRRRRAPLGQRAHGGGADRLGRRQRSLRCVRRSRTRRAGVHRHVSSPPATPSLV